MSQIVYKVYKNVRTGNEVIIIKQKNNLLLVEYVKSGTRSWFLKKEFRVLFNLR